TLPDKKWMLPNADKAVQITGGRPRFAGLALAADAHPHSVVDAGGNPDRGRPVDLNGPIAAARAGRIADHRAPAPARGTGLLEAKETLSLNENAVTVAAPAGDRLAAGFGARTAAFEAALLAGDFQLAARAAVGFDEVDLKGHLEVVSLPRAAAPA